MADRKNDNKTWVAGKPRKKPDYNAEAVTAELVSAVMTLYEETGVTGKHPSLQAIADELACGLNPMKVRKLLITAGEIFGKPVYESVMAEKAVKLWKEKKSVEEIMDMLGLSRASVHSYLPYSKVVYKMPESSVGADRMKVYRERKKAVEELRTEPDYDNLWNAILLFAGYPFKTSKGLKFTYKTKGNELFFSRKEKSITRSTVNIAYRKILESGGMVSGPKVLGVFGASYLYPVFVRFGVIKK